MKLKLDFSSLWAYRMSWVKGLESTLLVTLIALAVAVVIALVLAAFRLSKIKPLNWIASIYLSIFRGVPQIVQIMFIYFGIPQLTGHKFAPFVAGWLALG